MLLLLHHSTNRWQLETNLKLIIENVSKLTTKTLDKLNTCVYTDGINQGEKKMDNFDQDARYKLNKAGSKLTGREINDIVVVDDIADGLLIAGMVGHDGKTIWLLTREGQQIVMGEVHKEAEPCLVHPLATPLAQRLPQDACPYCFGTGKPDMVYGGVPTYAFGRIVDDGFGRRTSTVCHYCAGYGVEEDVLRAIYDGDDPLIWDDDIEAALKVVTKRTWSEWEDHWKEQDDIASSEAGDDDHVYDSWREYRAIDWGK